VGKWGAPLRHSKVPLGCEELLVEVVLLLLLLLVK